jgi:hypothetical protein
MLYNLVQNVSVLRGVLNIINFVHKKHSGMQQIKEL